MTFEARCRTTAMAIMPHVDIEKAIDLAVSLDIPFWPQLPRVSFFEDMYVQASENFPGIVTTSGKELYFDSARFPADLADYSRRMADPETFALSDRYSAVYRRFLERDLHSCTAIRGQVIGPVSFGFRVTDENNKPIIYDEEVKTLLFDFIQRKVNAQCNRLRQQNPDAFVWVDEPGLGWVFSGLSGYSDVRARQDYQGFLGGIDGIKALHLCANVNLPFLLGLGLDLLSFDAYQMELMPKGYASAVAGFISRGGVICWGIVPTDSSALDVETPESLAQRLTGYWEVVSQNSGLPVKQIAERALIAPARCCLKNIGAVGAAGEAAQSRHNATPTATIEERVVAKAFGYLRTVSRILIERFKL